jgi:predicted mannosyl-3-phosphoglycerate phosphatase (HAD superfamily)
MVLNLRPAARDGERDAGSLVIFTRVEGLLRERTHVALAAASGPLQCLAAWGVPLVLVSSWDASEIRQLQYEFASNQPFICEKGAALYVPRLWLGEPASANPGLDEEREWETFRFSPPSVSAAVRLLTAMFLTRGHDPLLTVGIGCDLADYNLLATVDIPIVVRDRSGSQPELLRQLPGAYVTAATGPAGWSEAVLGVHQ